MPHLIKHSDKILYSLRFQIYKYCHILYYLIINNIHYTPTGVTELETPVQSRLGQCSISSTNAFLTRL